MSALSLKILRKAWGGANPRSTHEDHGGRAEIIIRDKPYCSGVPGDNKLKLDIYSNPHDGRWPCIVLVHGGGWLVGDKSMDNKVYLSKVFANNGFVAFNINHRLAPRVHIRGMAEDVLAALAWVRKHAEEYGADPNRIAIVGSSAGGHLAALAAWARDRSCFCPTGLSTDHRDLTVKAVALYFPVIDLDRTISERTFFFSPLFKSFVVGAHGRRYNEVIKELSPAHQLQPGIPPTMFLCGDRDIFNLYPQCAEYEAKLKSIGVPTALFTARGKNHGFTWKYWEPESHRSAMEIVDFFGKYLE